MKIDKFEKTVVEALEKIKIILTIKNKEYVRGEDVFHNFENAKKISLHTTREAVAWEFMVKHLQSLKDIVNDVEKDKHYYLKQGLIDEKCIDIINYTLIIRAMLLNRIEEEK